MGDKVEGIKLKVVYEINASEPLIYFEGLLDPTLHEAFDDSVDFMSSPEQLFFIEYLEKDINTHRATYVKKTLAIPFGSIKRIEKEPEMWFVQN